MAVKQLLLISNGYPDAAAREKGFILPEIHAFLAAGYRVTIAPVRPIARLDADLPPEVTVDRGLASMYKPGQLLVTMVLLGRAGFFWKEMRIAMRHGKWAGFAHFLKESVRTMSMLRFGKRRTYDVLYTYWFKGETAGIGFLPRDGSLRITRAHGYDLYEERPHNRGYIPYREQTLPLLDRVVFLSEEARDYAAQRYSWVKTPSIISPLGVAVEPRLNPTPDGQRIQLVSCSYPTANKRLPLIAQLAAAIARQAPGLSVNWTHFGCSKQHAGLRLFAAPANLAIEFMGEVPHSRIQQWYRDSPVDFFINLSQSEGQPVSIMEAMAFGIPVVATAVGGVPCMLQEGGGLLLPATPDTDVAAREIIAARNSPERYAALRANALKTQRMHFNTAENHRRLVSIIDTLLA